MIIKVPSGPLQFKFLQLLGAEIFGAILALVGIFMFFRGITGKSDLILRYFLD
jgi:hypothetical protein